MMKNSTLDKSCGKRGQFFKKKYAGSYSQGKLYFIKDLTLKLNHDFSTRAILAYLLHFKP